MNCTFPETYEFAWPDIFLHVIKPGPEVGVLFAQT